MLVVALFATACGTDGEPADPPAPVFGDTPGPCGVTVLTNDTGDEAALRTAVTCALAQLDAREAFMWDLLVPTVEGDPVLYRFESDGERVTIVTDNTRDEFGSRTVSVQVCETIGDTGFVPEGVDCVDGTGAPFELPAGLWPP